MNTFNKKRYIAIIRNLLKEKKLQDFLLGKGQLEIVCKYAEMPTDPGLVYTYLKKYYFETTDEKLWDQLEEALLEMCKESESIWLVPYYFINIIRATNVNIDVIKIKEKFQANIKGFEQQLKDNKDWVGYQYQEGLMMDVKRMRKIIKEDYGCDL